MKKVVRIKESELVNLIDRMVKENVQPSGNAGAPDSNTGGADVKNDVKNAMDALGTYLQKQGIQQKLSKINNPIERGQFLAQLSQLIGFNSSDMGQAVKQLKSITN